jgi:hypothetical protein
MIKPKPPRPGRRRDHGSQAGGRRYTDPSGTRVALKQTGRHDDERINPDQDHELAYWSEKFGVSQDELRKAVQAAGPMVKDVQRHLNR